MPLFKLKPIDPVDFRTLNRPASPNTFLIAPTGFSAAGADQEAPIFNRALAGVMSAWDSMLGSQPRLSEVERSGDGTQRTYVQRTALMGYPDIITVRFVTMDDGKTSVAIYSRSQYGYSDMGKNRRRVLDWLNQLTVALK